MNASQFRCATDDDLKMPEFKGKSTREFEVNQYGHVFPKRRWEHALRQIAMHLELPSAAAGEANEILREFYLKHTEVKTKLNLETEEVQSRYPVCDDGSEPD